MTEGSRDHNNNREWASGAGRRCRGEGNSNWFLHAILPFVLLRKNLVFTSVSDDLTPIPVGFRLNQSS